MSEQDEVLARVRRYAKENGQPAGHVSATRVYFLPEEIVQRVAGGVVEVALLEGIASTSALVVGKGPHDGVSGYFFFVGDD